MKPPTKQSKSNDASCAHCGKSFRRARRNQVHCSPRCRKAHSQKTRRMENPINSRTSPTKRRREQEFFELSLRIAERLYGLPVGERLGFMQNLIEEARMGNTAMREILSNRYLLKANRSKPYLFHRRCPSAYFTIAQAAERYCRKFWRASVRDVVYGLAPEPPTGEVITNQSVVTINNTSNEDEGAAAVFLGYQDVDTTRCANQGQLAGVVSSIASEDNQTKWHYAWFGHEANIG